MAEKISALRRRMIEDMTARQLSTASQRSHIRSCKRFPALALLRRLGPGKLACSWMIGVRETFTEGDPGGVVRNGKKCFAT